MVFVLFSQIPLAPQLILCGPQEVKIETTNTIKKRFFILLIYNDLHVFQLFQIISFVRQSRNLVLTAQFVFFF